MSRICTVLIDLYRIFKESRLDKNEKSFIGHNKKVWKDNLIKYTENEILVEPYKVASDIISYSYLAQILSKKYKASIKVHIFQQLERINRLRFRKRKKVFNSFGAKIIFVDINKNAIDETTKLYEALVQNLKTKRDVEDLTIDGVWIGDLLYDSHLKSNFVPTIDLEDHIFHDSLKTAISYYIFWRDYLNSHCVKAILVSHCVYNIAIILRIAVKKDIPCFQINATYLYRIDSKNAEKYQYRAYNEFVDYKNNFLKLPQKEQFEGMKTAKQRIEKRFMGEIGVDMIYSNKSAYGRERNHPVLQKNEKIKVLIASHCFFDSPHPYGKNLFPDFIEWFDFLGKISKKTDYDWYIKTHPDFLPGNIDIIESLIKKFPKFKLIPSQTSHFQIIEEGINFALTVYGTIGFEYAELGIPVITASRNNPMIAYDFNIHPKNIAEYEQILMNLSQLELKINNDDVYAYYYMRFIRNNVENWLYRDYRKFLDEIGGYKNQICSISYRKFLDEYSIEKHNRIYRILNTFIESEDYCLKKRHIESAQPAIR